MSSEQESSLILGMEKRLGRSLTSAERRLIVLAGEELIASEKGPPSQEAKSAGSGSE